jgi:hypothetical protein
VQRACYRKPARKARVSRSKCGSFEDFQIRARRQ